MTYVPRLPADNVNVSPQNPLLDMLFLLGGCLAIVLGIFWVLGIAIDHAVEHLPPGFEQKLGAIIDTPGTPAPADARQKSAEAVLARLTVQQPNAHYPHALSVIAGEEVNAFAMPGGRIVVMRGLLDGVKSENELAMVLGHELGHFAHRDHLRGLGRGLVLGTLSGLLLGNDSSITRLLMGSLDIAQSSFSREQETTADLYGVDLLQKTYGHVGGATEFFERMVAEDHRWAAWTSSHPMSVDRITHIREYAASRGYRTSAVTALPPANAVFSPTAR